MMMSTHRSKSIIQDDTDYCFVCGRYGTEIHHCLYGNANRQLADKYGLVVGLCYNHHRGKQGVHNGNKELDMYLKQTAQRRFQEVYTESDFLTVFGKNYLYD